MLKIYRLISEIDWKDDGIILFWGGDEYQLIYPTLLSERQVDHEVTEIFTYFMEMQAAFALPVRKYKLALLPYASNTLAATLRLSRLKIASIGHICACETQAFANLLKVSTIFPLKYLHTLRGNTLTATLRLSRLKVTSIGHICACERQASANLLKVSTIFPLKYLHTLCCARVNLT